VNGFLGRLYALCRQALFEALSILVEAALKKLKSFTAIKVDRLRSV